MTSALDSRYENMPYKFCGSSGLRLPLVSLGLWQNFGENRPYDTQKAIVHRAFDLGIAHFDLANNYGPPVGEAERALGKILDDGLRVHRNELIISTKAGYRARPGPNGDGGSRKNLLASCDESLLRSGLDYFDIFYHHRMDGEIPLEETMGALDQLVHQGKALYVGVSSHTAKHFVAATEVIRAGNLTGLTSLMSRYHLLLREDESDKWPAALAQGVGGIAFSPLAEGLLTGRYLSEEVSADARHAGRLQGGPDEAAMRAKIEKSRKLNAIAAARGQTLAQMAIAWVLRNPPICSALIGASSIAQLEENAAAVNCLEFSTEELAKIDSITGSNV